MYTVSADSLQLSIKMILDQLMYVGKKVEVRGYNTLELHPCLIEITNPTKRTLLYPKRGNNPFATLAETLWVFSGRRDVAFLEKFLPRAKEFSDDGRVWRGGYGPRLRNYMGVNDKGEIVAVDQLEFVIKQIQKDRGTRQAVMTIWDPAKEDTIGNTKDYCCSNWIHFMVRDDKLDMLVGIRSNDLIFGMSAINMYEFTFIQEVIAKCLDIEIGKYFQLSDSMHVYEKFSGLEGIEKSAQLRESYIDLPDLPVFKFIEYGDDSLDKYKEPLTILNIYTKMVQDTLMILESKTNEPFGTSFQDINEIWLLLQCYLDRNNSNWCGWDKILPCIRFSDLKVSCDFWWRKNIYKVKDEGLKTIQESIERCKV